MSSLFSGLPLKGKDEVRDVAHAEAGSLQTVCRLSGDYRVFGYGCG